jgi:hypothetical protein
LTDFKNTLLKLNTNLHTLQRREAKYSGDVPVALLNQISDHQQAIALTEQTIACDLTEAEWREALRPLNIDHTLVEGGFFHKILQALSLASDQQREFRNRQIMLQRVHDFWVKSVLENSLHNEVLIDLGMETKPKAVEYPWDMVIQRPDKTNRTLPPGTKMINVFDESGGSLLILGEPGSGKTTMLLELVRALIVRAEEDPAQSIPVVFNLSSWSSQKQTIAEWLLEEFRTKYNIPKKIAKTWVENNELLLLLDGLDEVSSELLEACVQTLNKFYQEQMMPLVVCSRIADYEFLGAKLSLRRAILLQSLTPQQINHYIAGVGLKLEGVHAALQQDQRLQELAQSPLMLSIMVLAYKDFGGPPTFTGAFYDTFNTIGARRKHLLKTYVQRMFERRGANTRYTPELAIHWLTWLAQRMAQTAQTMFLIEWLQPFWLTSKSQKTVYLGAKFISFILLFGVVVGVACWAIFDLVEGIIFGLLIGPILGFLFGLKKIIEPLMGYSWSFSAGRIQIGWGVAFGLLFGLLLWASSGKMISLVIGIANGFLLGLGLGGYGATKQLQHPDQGVHIAAKNGIIISIIGGVMFGLIIGINSGPKLGFAGGIFIGVISGIASGLGTVIQHYTLRLVLWWNRHIPLNYAHFLDYCVERIFLRRVGGGYIFIHRYLMEYFASLTEEDIDRLSTEIEAGKA